MNTATIKLNTATIKLNIVLLLDSNIYNFDNDKKPIDYLFFKNDFIKELFNNFRLVINSYGTEDNTEYYYDNDIIKVNKYDNIFYISNFNNTNNKIKINIDTKIYLDVEQINNKDYLNFKNLLLIELFNKNSLFIAPVEPTRNVKFLSDYAHYKNNVNFPIFIENSDIVLFGLNNDKSDLDKNLKGHIKLNTLEIFDTKNYSCNVEFSSLVVPNKSLIFEAKCGVIKYGEFKNYPSYSLGEYSPVDVIIDSKYNIIYEFDWDIIGLKINTGYTFEIYLKILNLINPIYDIYKSIDTIILTTGWSKTITKPNFVFTDRILVLGTSEGIREYNRLVSNGKDVIIFLNLIC